jgi:hypothetical protein
MALVVVSASRSRRIAKSGGQGGDLAIPAKQVAQTKIMAVQMNLGQPRQTAFERRVQIHGPGKTHQHVPRVEAHRHDAKARAGLSYPIAGATFNPPSTTNTPPVT